MKRLILFFCLCLLTAGCAQKPEDKEIIVCEQAPAAIGPYSQAIRIGNTLYLSGQLGMDPATGLLVEGGLEAQARQALKNQQAVLRDAGFTLQDVVQCQVFLTDLDYYPVFNEVYKEFFPSRYPARAVLEVSRIPADGLVEIMMVAVK